MKRDPYADLASWDYWVALGLGAGVALMLWTGAWMGLVQ